VVILCVHSETIHSQTTTNVNDVRCIPERRLAQHDLLALAPNHSNTRAAAAIATSALPQRQRAGDR
jgi:hypothetical protein